MASRLTDLMLGEVETSESGPLRTPSAGTKRQILSTSAGSWGPPPASAGSWGLCFSGSSRFGSSGGRCLADTRQHALRRLEIGQPSGDCCAFGLETRQTLADLRFLRADLVQYRGCCGRHGGLQWLQSMINLAGV